MSAELQKMKRAWLILLAICLLLLSHLFELGQAKAEPKSPDCLPNLDYVVTTFNQSSSTKVVTVYSFTHNGHEYLVASSIEGGVSIIQVQ